LDKPFGTIGYGGFRRRKNAEFGLDAHRARNFFDFFDFALEK